MGLSVTCPGCKTVHKVKDSARGKKVRCPTEGCGHVLTIPQAPAPQAPAVIPAERPPTEEGQGDTFRLAITQADTVPAPARHRAQEQSSPSAPGVGRAKNQVLMSDGRIRAMSLKEIREALRQGTITRFSLMKPTDDNDGSARRRKSDESGWTPIGYSVFIDTQDEPAYVTKAARAGMAHRNTVATITGIMVFTLVAIGIGVGLYLVKVDLNVEMVAVVSAATVFGTVTSQLWQAGFAFINGAFIGVALAGMTFGMVRWLPEASLFLMKAIVFVLGLLLARAFAKGLGALGAIAFDYSYRALHHDPEDTGPAREKKVRPPYDGYPWMFWKSSEQRRLLKQSLSARE